MYRSSDSGPLLTNTTDAVANKISLIQQQSVHKDITQLFSTNSNVRTLISNTNAASVGLGNVATTAPSYFASAASVNAINKTSVSLFNVANTKPSDLPFSTATQTALGLKAPLASPSLTGKCQ